VADALVLVDRLEGASSKLRSLGVRLTSFITVEDIAPLRKGGVGQDGEKLTASFAEGPRVEGSLR